MKHLQADHRGPSLVGSALALALALGPVQAQNTQSVRAPGGPAVQTVSTTAVSAARLAAPAPDTDGDGLMDPLEVLLGTSIQNVDSDDDGFGDSEELARGSDPVDAASTPDASPVALGMAVSAHDGKINAVTALYFQDGILDDKLFQLGVLIRGTLTTMSPNRYGNPGLEIIPSSVPGELVVVLEARLHAGALHQTGALSVFATVSDGTGFVAAADAVDLVSVEGVILERNPGTLLGMNSSSSSGQGAQSGAFYTPLGGSIPSNWVGGSVCVQSLSVVGVSGGVVSQEVDAAGCQDGFSGSCSPGGCAGSVGSVIQTVDPVALIGT